MEKLSNVPDSLENLRAIEQQLEREWCSRGAQRGRCIEGR